MNFNQIIFKIKTIYHTDGMGLVFQKGIKRILTVSFQRNSAIWFQRNLFEEINIPDSEFPVKVNLLTGDETLDWIKTLNKEWMFDIREINLGVNQGHYFGNAKWNNETVGYIKVGFNKVYVLDYEKVIKFPPRLAFIYDTFVLPNYRGKGIASQLISESLCFLKEKGFKGVLCHIPPWNESSISAYTRNGFKEIKEINYFRILGIRLFSSNINKMLGTLRFESCKIGWFS
jgi:ribosomal protein S18 acetylase RimI-like enzyme